MMLCAYWNLLIECGLNQQPLACQTIALPLSHKSNKITLMGNSPYLSTGFSQMVFSPLKEREELVQ